MRAMHDSAEHILVVDDDQSVLEALSAGLGFTYVVHTAATGEEACDVLQCQPIAAIVLDVVLGSEDGLDLIGRFRAIYKGPILILTGHSTEELAIRAVRAGADGYLKKPVNLQELHAALCRMMNGTDSPNYSVAKACYLLMENIDRKHTTATLAKAVGLSRRQLYRQFFEVVGKTPGRYLTGMRLQRAVELLCSTGMAIKQIACQVGYASGVAFNRAFKRLYGIAPSAFRAGQRDLGAQKGKEARGQGADGKNS